MLERPDVFTEKSSNSDNDKSSGIVNSEHYKEKKIESETDNNLDGIFFKISELYTEEHLSIIYNTLKLVKKHPEDCVTYMDGLNHIFSPINTEIKKWINEHLIF